MLTKIRFVVLIYALLIFAGVPSSAFAVSVIISNVPSTITQDPFTLTASISGATNGTNYLRVDMYKDGTTNYFGETFNGTDWYGSSSYQSYLPITIAGNAWNGQVQGRIASPSTSQYDGTGTYKIRLRRYTSSGGYTASEADNSAVVVSIAIPTPTPIPTNTPAPTNTPYPTIQPTSKPYPAIATISPTAIFVISVASQSATLSGVLGSSISASPSLVEGMKDTKVSSVSLPALFLILLGIVVLSSCGILIFYRFRKGTVYENNNQ